MFKRNNCTICGKKTQEPYMHFCKNKYNLGIVTIERNSTTFCTQDCGLAWFKGKL